MENKGKSKWQNTGAEMDSAPTPAKLIVFTDIKLIIYKICS